MNKDQTKGMTKDIMGKTQESTGKMTGNKTQQAKGLAKQAAGKVQKAYGDAKESVKNTTRKTH
jgi:uncharacterized protein YjbJ (UPF0337 family)